MWFLLVWHREEFPDLDLTSYHAAAREIALGRDVRVLASRDRGVPVAYAQLEYGDRGAEITGVYVRPDRRGEGRGTAITRAAIEVAAGAGDLWIVADDEGRPKQLYGRLGFVPAWTTMEFLRRPVPPWRPASKLSP